jgi:hypothetical protein
MVQIPAFMRFHWLKILVTYVMVPSCINAIYSLNPTILMWTFLIEIGLVAIAVIAMALYNRRSLLYSAIAITAIGMIFTVGNQLDTIRFAIDHQKPKFIGLICSAETEGKANMLKDEIGLDEEHVMKKEVDPKNIDDIRAMTISILNWFRSKGLHESEIAVDITGGLTTMSAGAFDACEKEKIDSQYIFSKYVNNKVIMDTKDAILFAQHGRK